jgi:hypothetical protein
MGQRSPSPRPSPPGRGGNRSGFPAVRISLSPIQPDGFGASAFTRLDLIVLLGLLGFMATWLGCSFFGERGRTANCAQKLAALGTAMQNFADDHNGALPAASMEQPYQAWDSQVAQYLPRRLVKNGLDPAFRCPSDRLDRTRPRSYAMSGHNMGWENWPPGPEMRTGVGLTWTRANMQRLLGEDMVAVAQTNSSLLARIKVAMVPAPAETLLLTEAIHAANNLKDIRGATVSGSGLQMDGLKADQPGFHYGEFNYLMVDGRIEALSPFLVQTLSGNAGIWTVKAGD